MMIKYWSKERISMIIDYDYLVGGSCSGDGGWFETDKSIDRLIAFFVCQSKFSVVVVGWFFFKSI